MLFTYSGMDQIQKEPVQLSSERIKVKTKIRKFKNNCLTCLQKNKAFVISIVTFAIGALACTVILRAVNQGILVCVVVF